METIVRMHSGSRVYGCSVPESDTDYKFVFQPNGRDILLQRAPTQKQNKTNKTDQKNTKDDIDEEGFSLQQYLKLVSQGQTIAIDMLFTPKEFFVQRPTYVWFTILHNKKKLISKKSTAFVGYCRAQFSKYCVKSERLAAVKDIVAVLAAAERKQEVSTLKDQILPLLEKHKDIILWKDHQLFPSLEVCGRQAQLHLKNDKALEIFSRVLESYGTRTEQALHKGSVDWKALYHAVRVAREAEELLLTENITFPRPEAALLLEIRKGEKSYDEVADLIEDGLIRVQNALEKTTLPDEPDHAFMEEIVYLQNKYSVSWQGDKV